MSIPLETSVHELFKRYGYPTDKLPNHEPVACFVEPIHDMDLPPWIKATRLTFKYSDCNSDDGDGIAPEESGKATGAAAEAPQDQEGRKGLPSDDLAQAPLFLIPRGGDEPQYEDISSSEWDSDSDSDSSSDDEDLPDLVPNSHGDQGARDEGKKEGEESDWAQPRKSTPEELRTKEAIVQVFSALQEHLRSSDLEDVQYDISMQGIAPFKFRVRQKPKKAVCKRYRVSEVRIPKGPKCVKEAAGAAAALRHDHLYAFDSCFSDDHEKDA